VGRRKKFALWEKQQNAKKNPYHPKNEVHQNMIYQNMKSSNNPYHPKKNSFKSSLLKKLFRNLSCEKVP